MENEEQNNNEEQNLSPDATTSDLEVETLEESHTNQSRSKKIGPIIIVTVSVFCLVVVCLAVYSNLTTPKEVPVVEPEVIEEEIAEVLDETVVEGRDPDVLGLRVDTVIGRLFVLPESGQTLYVTNGDCVDDCLGVWNPYEAEAAITDSGLLGTVERADGTLQYTWDGKALYTFNMDDKRSVLGDGYEGRWNIARP